MEKTAKDLAISIYERVKSEGYSTDYCFSSNFLQQSKDMAIARAKAKFTGSFCDEIVDEIKKL